jgi:hypothetical protein
MENVVGAVVNIVSVKGIIKNIIRENMEGGLDLEVKGEVWVMRMKLTLVLK